MTRREVSTYYLKSENIDFAKLEYDYDLDTFFALTSNSLLVILKENHEMKGFDFV